MLQYPVFCALFLMTSHLGHVNARVEPLIKLPSDLQHNFDVNRRLTNLSEQPGSLIFWSSLQLHMSTFITSRRDVPPAQANLFRHLVEEFMKPVYKPHEGLKPRTRVEVRLLTTHQREAYFKAVNAMKHDKILSPNVYDFLADFHRGDDLIDRAHGGPAFPAWHRIYLWLYESFLRRYDPTVTIPYWASVLDNKMDDSTESVIFTHDFYGNEDLTSGPFQDWNTVNPNRPISRNLGTGRALYSYEAVESIVQKTRNKEILVPYGTVKSNLEILHGGPHNFVGGSMGQLDQASRDPIFFSHHAFVDYIWEKFREHQRNSKINPETDYPFDSSVKQSHSPNSTMGFLQETTYNADIPNRIGYWNVFFDLVRYEPVPKCPDCGGSPYLYCNHTLTVPRCVSRTRGYSQTTLLFRSEITLNDPQYVCPRKPFMRERDFVRIPSGPKMNWVYIPVIIVNKRPPHYANFEQYSLYGYTGRVPPSKQQFVQKGHQKGFAKCSRREDSVGKIATVAYGVNYYGKAYGYAIVDNRLGLSIATGYAVVKAPSTGSPTDAIVAAYDSCGRVCQPYCVNGTEQTNTFKCNGAVRVTPESPAHYSNSYASATLESWYMPPDGSGRPAIYQPNVPLMFYCEEGVTWIWGDP